MAIAKKVVQRLKIRRGIRKKVQGTAAAPRLAVYKSNKSIYAQVIDDVSGKTLASATSFGSDMKGSKADVAQEVGKLVAEAAKSSGIEKVVFDRGGYIYHGRVKALADGAREAGLKF
jgi:large subunit ribosomal protein L18